jgi:hypothetical protein
VGGRVFIYIICRQVGRDEKLFDLLSIVDRYNFHV